MDIVLAAQECLDNISKYEWETEDDNTNVTHTRYLLKSIIHKDVVGAKAHRWLGWAQCSIHLYGNTELKGLKLRNKRA